MNTMRVTTTSNSAAVRTRIHFAQHSVTVNFASNPPDSLDWRPRRSAFHAPFAVVQDSPLIKGCTSHAPLPSSGASAARVSPLKNRVPVMPETEAPR